MKKLQNIFIGKFKVVVPRKIKNLLFEDWKLSHLKLKKEVAFY